MSPKKAATIGRVSKKETSVDHAEVSKMLRYLKHHKAKAGSDADAAPFAEASSKHSSLPPSENKTCLSKFQKNKKDLSWAQTFHENADEVSTQKEASISVFFQPIRDREDERIRAQFDVASLDVRVILTCNAKRAPTWNNRQSSVGLVFTQSLHICFCCFVLFVAHTSSATGRRLGPLRDVGAAIAPRVQL